MAIKPDNRPRCYHDVVYPMDNCTLCMQEEIQRLNSHILAIGSKLKEVSKELEEEKSKNELLQNEVFTWIKYIKVEEVKPEDKSNYYYNLSLLACLGKTQLNEL